MSERQPQSPLFSPRSGTEALVRYLYLEPLLPRKDVLVVAQGDGAETIRFIETLAVRSASHAPPPDRAPLPADMAAVRGRSDAQATDARGLAFRDAAFDVVFVPEVAGASDPGLLFREVARVLRPSGAALVATRNASCLVPISVPPEGGHAEVWTYSRLLALVRTCFRSVRMVGQGPFLGYTFVEYDPRAIPDVRLDTSLMKGRGEDPEYFVAVCGTGDPTELPLPALFQLPLQEFTVAELLPEERGVPAVGEGSAVAALAAEEEALALRSDVERLREEMAERNVRIARLEQEVVRAEQDAAAARDRATKLVREIEAERKAEQRKAIEATFARAAHRSEINGPPQAPEAGESRATAAAAEELARLRAELDGRGLEIEKLRAALREAERRASEGERAHEDLAEAERALKAADARAAAAEEARAKAEKARTDAESAARAHVREIEERLHERGRKIAEVERLADERARIVEDLLRELKHGPPASAEPAVPDAVQVRAATPSPPPARRPSFAPELPPAASGPFEEAWAAAEGKAVALQEAVARLEGELTGAQWRNAELDAALSETFEEVQRLEADAVRLAGALEVAQLAAEEMAKAAVERDTEVARLEAAVERLVPFETEAASVGRLVEELQRQAADLRQILAARREESGGSAAGA